MPYLTRRFSFLSNLGLFRLPWPVSSPKGRSILMHAPMNLEVLIRTCILRRTQCDAVNSVIQCVPE